MILFRFNLEGDGNFTNIKAPENLFRRAVKDGMFNARRINDLALRYGVKNEPSKSLVVGRRGYDSSGTSLLFSRSEGEIAPGPVPWPGYYGPLPHVVLGEKAFNGCFAIYLYFDVSVGIYGPPSRHLFKFLDQSNRYSFFRTWKTLLLVSVLILY